MNTSILFTLWLNLHTDNYSNAYQSENKLYFKDNSIDMILLFDIFLNSKFYANYLALDIVLKDSELVKNNINALEVKENDYHKKSELSNLYLDAKTLHEDISTIECNELDKFVESLKSIKPNII